ncbi:TIR domain-containing protein [candidate division KSB1 bacterium]|nr:TIR domain-containing protein [candidate division KSB1 bacterium]
MPGHHFLSYSRFDAEDFALRLHDALEAGAPSFSVWLDKIDLKPGQDWDEQIAEAIRVCGSLLFVMTRDSVNPQSTCKLEWTRALKYKKPILPLLLHPDAEPPFRLATRQYLDFTRDFDSALAKLRQHLNWLASPQGKLRELRYRLEDAQRDLSRSIDAQQRMRIEADIILLEQQIADQRHALDNLQAAEKHVEENIAAGLERERQPQRVLTTSTNNKFINPPPGVAPSYFQGRHIETNVIGDFLKDEALRLLTVVGRGGIGKTALVCRVLKALESGHLPDDGGPLAVDGIVYLSATGTRRLNVPNLFADLCKLLPDDTAKALDTLYKNPQATTEAKMRALLEAFLNGRTVVLLDNFEDLLDATTRNVNDAELDEALCALLNLPQRSVKVIVTTRVAPHDLALLQPARQRHLHLEEGLESPYAEKLLREMDADGKLGLKTAPDDLLKEARERTRGFPRALEALFAILSADRDTSLQEILADTEKLLPENVIEALVGEAFSRLDAVGQQVMQALAVYNRPVTANAVDYLLQPYLPDIDSAPVLKRLVNMHFVRKEAGRYYLHPIDRAYAFGRVPKGEVLDRNEIEAPKYTQFALLHRGAEYFKQARKPQEEWKTIEDLEPQLAEFELRFEGKDYDTAADILLEIRYEYLDLWGYYRLVLDLSTKLENKSTNPQRKDRIVHGQGTAYLRMGDYPKAIVYFEKALKKCREAKDRKEEGRVLGSLGNVFLFTCQYTRAIDYCEQALIIDHETKNKRSVGKCLGGLGFAYRDLGQTLRAIDYIEQGLVIAREIKDRRDESLRLGSLGECYANLGQITRAIDYHMQGLIISHEIGFRAIEGLQLASLSEMMIDAGRYDEALTHAFTSSTMSTELGFPFLGSRSNLVLALACLYSGDLTAARKAVLDACQYNEPRNNYKVFSLLGVIALRQGDHTAAQEAFKESITKADTILDLNNQNYFDAWDAKGLAYSGLALCESSEHIPKAIEAYRAARALCKDAGIVNRVLRLFDALTVVDEKGILAEVRKAAAGENRLELNRLEPAQAGLENKNSKMSSLERT